MHSYRWTAIALSILVAPYLLAYGFAQDNHWVTGAGGILQGAGLVLTLIAHLEERKRAQQRRL